MVPEGVEAFDVQKLGEPDAVGTVLPILCGPIEGWVHVEVLAKDAHAPFLEQRGEPSLRKFEGICVAEVQQPPILLVRAARIEGLLPVTRGRRGRQPLWPTCELRIWHHPLGLKPHEHLESGCLGGGA